MTTKFSPEALALYPLADIGNTCGDFLIVALCTGIVGAFYFAGQLLFGSNRNSKVAISGLVIGSLIGLSPIFISYDTALANIFDAPSVIVGEVSAFTVAPGGLFTAGATNVQFKDGTGLSMKGTPTLKIGDVINSREYRGNTYYSVSGQTGKPNFFQ